MKKVTFKFLTGDVDYKTYSEKWISTKKYNSGKFDYWFVLELINWEDTIGEREAKEVGAKYNVSLFVVSPSKAGEEKIKRAMSCCGIEDAEVTSLNDEMKVELLHSYGVCTPVWYEDGNNFRKLMKRAKEEARACEFLFGFYMDRPINKIGATGWEGLRGDIVEPALKRIASR